MRVVSAKVIDRTNDTIDIKFSNGIREFIANLEKKEINFENIKRNEVNVRVYSMIRNCCSASPLYILESFKNREDDLEIAEILARFIELIGEDIKNNRIKFLFKVGT